jgi:hypothetical protein
VESLPSQAAFDIIMDLTEIAVGTAVASAPLAPAAAVG